ncbi:winged helix DNA-binding domain-containing protein [Cohnella caldifontis]|uniref:winged helix DNA-binding domain-containing protein n=1 Tax=Cohnella caldifontis TaxID=3027471 RepID=UPI0023EBE45D|nr:winged helix DNA-binding domain-containing protein [Cohnella sp. YIM B05605]
MDDRAIARLRLRSQRIAGGKFAAPEEAAKGLGALQAQDYGQALWAIGLRTSGAAAADVEQAIEERKIVLTWPLRGTLHAVPAEDAKWMLRHFAPRVIGQFKRRREQLELDDAVLSRCRELIRRALEGGRRITRPDLMELLESGGIATGNQRGYHIVFYLALNEFICLGPLEGKQQTFVLLDEWVPRPRELSAEEALHELTVRYVRGHGPATAHDFAWWAGLTVTDARKALESASGELRAVQSGGTAYWMSRDVSDEAGEKPAGTFLLAGFDQFLLGYTDRAAVLHPDYAPRIVPGGNGIFQPTVVSDGRVVGTWKRTIKKKGIDVDVAFFEPVPGAEEQAMSEIRRYCAFMGLPPGNLRVFYD